MGTFHGIIVALETYREALARADLIPARSLLQPLDSEFKFLVSFDSNLIPTLVVNELEEDVSSNGYVDSQFTDDDESSQDGELEIDLDRR